MYFVNDAIKSIFINLIVIFMFFALTANAKTQSLDEESFYHYLQPFDLINQDDKPIDFSELEGYLVIVNFMFTSCPSICPMQNGKLAKLYQSIPEHVQEKVKFLSISIDPKRDTPAVLKKYAQQINVKNSYWTFATGTVESTEKIKKELQLMAPVEKQSTLDELLNKQSALDDHRIAIWLLDDSGQIMQRYRGNPIDDVRIMNEVLSLYDFKFSNK